MAGPTRKQQLFIDAYTGEAYGNATQAAKIAGYSSSGSYTNLRQVASRLLKNQKVKEAIEKIHKEQDDKRFLDREGRRELLSQIATDPKSTKHEKMKAIELLGKMGGDYVERRQVDVTEYTKQKQDALSTLCTNSNPQIIEHLLDELKRETDNSKPPKA